MVDETKSQEQRPDAGLRVSLKRAIRGSLASFPGRFPDLEGELRDMPTGALRDLHRLLRECEDRQARAKRRIRRGF